MTHERPGEGGSAPIRPGGAPGETTTDSPGRLDAEHKRNLEELSREQLERSAADLHVEVGEGWSKQDLIEAIEQSQRLEQERKNS